MGGIGRCLESCAKHTDTLRGRNTKFLNTEYSGACSNRWGFYMVKAFCVTYYFPILRKRIGFYNQDEEGLLRDTSSFCKCNS